MASDLLVPGQKFMLIEETPASVRGIGRAQRGIYAGWRE